MRSRLFGLVFALVFSASAVATSGPAGELPSLRLQGLDGGFHELNEWRGKPLIVNFWASWCSPCQYEIPDLVRFQNQYADKGLQVVSVGLDKERPLRNVHRTLGINYPVLLGDPARHSRLLAALGNRRQIVPFTLVVDREGRIIYRHTGRFGQDAFDTYVLPMLGE